MIVLAWGLVAFLVIATLSFVGFAAVSFSDRMPLLGTIAILSAGLCVWGAIAVGDAALHGPLYECDYVEQSPNVYVEQCERVR